MQINKTFSHILLMIMIEMINSILFISISHSQDEITLDENTDISVPLSNEDLGRLIHGISDDKLCSLILQRKKLNEMSDQSLRKKMKQQQDQERNYDSSIKEMNEQLKAMEKEIESTIDQLGELKASPVYRSYHSYQDNLAKLNAGTMSDDDREDLFKRLKAYWDSDANCRAKFPDAFRVNDAIPSNKQLFKAYQKLYLQCAQQNFATINTEIHRKWAMITTGQLTNSEQRQSNIPTKINDLKEKLKEVIKQRRLNKNIKFSEQDLFESRLTEEREMFQKMASNIFTEADEQPSMISLYKATLEGGKNGLSDFDIGFFYDALDESSSEAEKEWLSPKHHKYLLQIDSHPKALAIISSFRAANGISSMEKDEFHLGKIENYAKKLAKSKLLYKILPDGEPVALSFKDLVEQYFNGTLESEIMQLENRKKLLKKSLGKRTVDLEQLAQSASSPEIDISEIACPLSPRSNTERALAGLLRDISPFLIDDERILSPDENPYQSILTLKISSSGDLNQESLANVDEESVKASLKKKKELIRLLNPKSSRLTNPAIPDYNIEEYFDEIITNYFKNLTMNRDSRSVSSVQVAEGQLKRNFAELTRHDPSILPTFYPQLKIYLREQLHFSGTGKANFTDLLRRRFNDAFVQAANLIIGSDVLSTKNKIKDSDDISTGNDSDNQPSQETRKPRKRRKARPVTTVHPG